MKRHDPIELRKIVLGDAMLGGDVYYRCPQCGMICLWYRCLACGIDLKDDDAVYANGDPVVIPRKDKAR